MEIRGRILVVDDEELIRKSLQRLLGHTTPAMTSRYVNFAAGDLAQLHSRVSPLDRQIDSDKPAKIRRWQLSALGLLVNIIVLWNTLYGKS